MLLDLSTKYDSLGCSLENLVLANVVFPPSFVTIISDIESKKLLSEQAIKERDTKLSEINAELTRAVFISLSKRVDYY